MLKIPFVAGLLMLSVFCNSAVAQSLNWANMDSVNHILTANFALDYSVSYGIGYGYALNTRLPVVLNASLSAPFGEEAVDDFKAKLGGQVCLLNKSNFVGAVSLFGIYRRYENQLIQLQNFGSEMKGVIGFYKKQWFLAGEVGFDKAIVTHFRHSKTYKETIFPDVQDGWYEPATGGNFYYGIQTGYSFKRSACTLNIGSIMAQDFKTKPLIPYYLTLSYHHNFN